MMAPLWRWISHSSSRRPGVWLGVALLISLPALIEVRKIGLDTNLKRLLPEHSAAVEWSNRLEEATGDGGYFSLLIEGDDRAVLEAGIERIASEVAALPAVHSVDYKNPIDFIEHYRYLLVERSQLEEFRNLVEDWEIEVNPFLLDLDEPSDDEEDDSEEREEKLREQLEHYARMGEYQTDADDRIFGMIIRTAEGIGDLNSLRTLMRDLEGIAGRVAGEANLWSGISGNLRNRVDEFDLIVADLGRAGLISVLAILLTLTISFRTVRVLPVLLGPLLIGLLWSFALVPTLVGDLNTITAFLLLVLFGMGVDYAIHLVSRFQVELAATPEEPTRALEETLRSTGRSVLTSGTTTALALSVLAISDFRGFSDFGIIGGSSMAMIVVSMLFVLPAMLVVGTRLGLVTPQTEAPWKTGRFAPRRVVASVLTVVVLAAGGLAASRLEFDYDFTNLSAKLPEGEPAKERHREVYPTTSAPAALYVGADLESVDDLLARLDERRQEDGDDRTIGALTSLRQFAPSRQQFEARLEVLAEIRDILEGDWVRRIDDPDKIELIDDFLAWTPPESSPAVDDVPGSLRDRLTAQDGSGRFLVGVDTNGRSRDGRMAMAFTEDLYGLELSEAIEGPTGDKPVLAEILWLVTRESPWIVGATFAGIFLLVLLDRRSVRQTLWVLFPLVAGLVLTLGIMVVAGWKLNFFNMVVLPTILGVGVDHGVHYYRRWRELERSTNHTQEELFLPITVCSLTSMMGYLGMVAAHHPGLRSIGTLALVGLGATWLTALFFLPGLLRWRTHGFSRRR